MKDENGDFLNRCYYEIDLICFSGEGHKLMKKFFSGGLLFIL